MEQISNQVLSLVPAKYHAPLLVAAVLAPYATRAYHAITNGGGLKGMWNAVWFGTNTPKISSTDQPQNKTP